MNDSYNRNINYLRISLTDLCNLRCKYCMPENGVAKLCHSDILSFEEIIEIVSAFSKIGISKVRLTGGEPLLKKGITSLCQSISSLPDIEDLSLTTNGILLPSMATSLKNSGVNRVNISIDSLIPDKYKEITRGGNINEVLDGISTALHVFKKVKLNVVLIGGFNDNEITDFVNLTMDQPFEIRFIELMPIGNVSCFDENAYIPSETVLKTVPELQKIGTNGVAELYSLPGAKGSVGLIHPLSCSFCSSCNRIRLTSDGYLKPCLYSKNEINIRGLHGDDLNEAIQNAILSKPEQHPPLSGTERAKTERNMNEIGG